MNENLSFNVAQLLKEAIGATRTGQVVADVYRLVPELRPEDRAATEPEPALTGEIRLLRTGTGVLVQGSLHADVSISCSRCLEPLNAPLDIWLEEVFAQTIDIVTGQSLQPEEEDRALWIDERHILDLTEVLRQNLLLAIPMHPLCREDCRGLCPTCGQNLNTGTCSCEPEPDPRWAGLIALLKKSE